MKREQKAMLSFMGLAATLAIPGAEVSPKLGDTRIKTIDYDTSVDGNVLPFIYFEDGGKVKIDTLVHGKAIFIIGGVRVEAKDLMVSQLQALVHAEVEILDNKTITEVPVPAMNRTLRFVRFIIRVK